MSGVYSYTGSGYLPMTPPGGAPLSGSYGTSYAMGAIDMTAIGYEAATVLGAAAGGGLVGYVAAKTQRGAIRGAALSSGLALIADGVSSFRVSATGKGVVLGLLGVLSAGWSVRDMMKQKRR